MVTAQTQDITVNLVNSIDPSIKISDQTVRLYKDGVLEIEVITNADGVADFGAVVTGVESGEELPTRLFVDAATVPNPVQNRGTISLELDKPTQITFSVLDISGREVKSLQIQRELSEGSHQFQTQISGSSDGVYYPPSYSLEDVHWFIYPPVWLRRGMLRGR